MEEKRKVTEAQKRSFARYEKKFDRVNCRLDSGTKKRIENAGYASINTFIRLAVAEKLEREEKILNMAQKN